MRIALAHDWLVGMRGGERVLERLADIAQSRSREAPVPLHVMVTNGRPHGPAIDGCRVLPSPLQQVPGSGGRLRRWLLPLYPWAVDRIRVAPCDLLISTSSAAIKGVRPPEGAVHICYCHSPARYIWTRPEQYGGGLRGLGLRLARRRFQRWDHRTAETVDHFLANSTYTAAQIESCFGRSAVVVHPPVRTEFFTPPAEAESARDRGHRAGGAFVIVAALEPYKRIDIAIEAANRLAVPLIVAGDGSDLPRLRQLAGPTVELRGRVTDEAVRSLYREARAFLFPAEEDFGIAPVEAMACGCPVIAYRGGGAIDSVQDDVGVLFDEQSVDGLVDAMQRFELRAFDGGVIRAWVERFSEAAFDERMNVVIDTVMCGGSLAPETPI